MSPEEIMPVFYPQVYIVSDIALSDSEFPQVSIKNFSYFSSRRNLNFSQRAIFGHRLCLMFFLLQLELSQKSTLLSDRVYLFYNAIDIFLYVGAGTDPTLINILFKVSNFAEINPHITEEEIFEDAGSSEYLAALQNLIYQVRY